MRSNNSSSTGAGGTTSGLDPKEVGRPARRCAGWRCPFGQGSVRQIPARHDQTRPAGKGLFKEGAVKGEEMSPFRTDGDCGDSAVTTSEIWNPGPAFSHRGTSIFQ